MYIKSLCERMPEIALIRNELYEVTVLLGVCYKNGGKLLLCGNGGSAADAEHIVGELMKGFLLPRPIPQHICDKMCKYGVGEELCGKLQQGIPAISLVAGIAFPTAFGNDVNPEYIFAQQIFVLGKPEDVLVAISTSGNSPNVVAAAQVAKSKGLKVVSLTGSKASKLADIADIAIKAPSQETPLIQEYHVAIYHAICAELEHRLFQE